MRVLDPGHSYSLDNLKSGGTTKFRFYKDAAIHGKGHAGPSCQEVIRMLIDRVQVLDSEKPWAGNESIVQKAREMLLLFELRALEMDLTEGVPIESLPVGLDGHTFLVIGVEK